MRPWLPGTGTPCRRRNDRGACVVDAAAARARDHQHRTIDVAAAQLGDDRLLRAIALLFGRAQRYAVVPCRGGRRIRRRGHASSGRQQLANIARRGDLPMPAWRQRVEQQPIASARRVPNVRMKTSRLRARQGGRRVPDRVLRAVHPITYCVYVAIPSVMSMACSSAAAPGKRWWRAARNASTSAMRTCAPRQRRQALAPGPATRDASSSGPPANRGGCFLRRWEPSARGRAGRDETARA